MLHGQCGGRSVNSLTLRCNNVFMSFRHFENWRESRVSPNFQGDIEIQNVFGLESLEGSGCV